MRRFYDFHIWAISGKKSKEKAFWLLNVSCQEDLRCSWVAYNVFLRSSSRSILRSRADWKLYVLWFFRRRNRVKLWKSCLLERRKSLRMGFPCYGLLGNETVLFCNKLGIRKKILLRTVGVALNFLSFLRKYFSAAILCKKKVQKGLIYLSTKRIWIGFSFIGNYFHQRDFRLDV